MLRILVCLFFVAIVIVFGSIAANRLWAGKPEHMPENIEVVVKENMTIGQFGKANQLDRKILKRVFGLQNPSDLKKKVQDSGFTAEQLKTKVNQAMALKTEHETKNWLKIPVKGVSWLVFLTVVFLLLRQGMITAQNRKIIYLAAIVIFGIMLGSDPSPMGTVKDAIVLFGSKGVIFPPRLVAFGVFMLFVVLANKFICSWGCQLGTLQDYIFRLNRDKSDRKGLSRQIKVPFFVSNSVRILFFILFSAAAFIWSIDIVGKVDPFKIYNPKVIGIIGGIFIALVLAASLFIYRPWCHFFCPFGLVSWLGEKISIFKIKVNYDKCTACGACSKACPSTVMDAILKQDRVIPDCFSCGNCIETCPVKAVSFGKGKRQKPPEGKFTKTKDFGNMDV